MESGPKVLGLTGGAGAVASLPNTGGSHNIVTYVALASVAIGVAVLLSSAVRFVAKRRFNA